MARKTNKVNPNTDKSRTRYDLLKRVAKAIFPTKENKLGGSKILTQFTEALYLESANPEKLPDEEIRRITKQVLLDLIQGMDA